MAHKPWYQNFAQLSEEVVRLNQLYAYRARELGTSATELTREVDREIRARIVHESNWQEGIYVDPNRTRELTDAVFANETTEVPALDINKFLAEQRSEVLLFKQQKKSDEEIASYNLAATQLLAATIYLEVQKKKIASYIQAALLLQKKARPDHLSNERFQRTIKSILRRLEETKPPDLPLIKRFESDGEYMAVLASQPASKLAQRLTIDHVLGLHRSLLMGLINPSKCGRFRTGPVHVGNPDLLLAPARIVPLLVEELLHDASRILDESDPKTLILSAARLSHRFVVIHPFADGNGRISRVLMNLLLGVAHPDIYLKADKKGRHRYIQALRRADRGNIEPLAALMSMSLIEVYHKILNALGVDSRRDSVM